MTRKEKPDDPYFEKLYNRAGKIIEKLNDQNTDYLTAIPIILSLIKGIYERLDRIERRNENDKTQGSTEAGH